MLHLGSIFCSIFDPPYLDNFCSKILTFLCSIFYRNSKFFFNNNPLHFTEIETFKKCLFNDFAEFFHVLHYGSWKERGFPIKYGRCYPGADRPEISIYASFLYRNILTMGHVHNFLHTSIVLREKTSLIYAFALCTTVWLDKYIRDRRALCTHYIAYSIFHNSVAYFSLFFEKIGNTLSYMNLSVSNSADRFQKVLQKFSQLFLRAIP